MAITMSMELLISVFAVSLVLANEYEYECKLPEDDEPKEDEPCKREGRIVPFAELDFRKGVFEAVKQRCNPRVEVKYSCFVESYTYNVEYLRQLAGGQLNIEDAKQKYHVGGSGAVTYDCLYDTIKKEDFTSRDSYDVGRDFIMVTHNATMVHAVCGLEDPKLGCRVYNYNKDRYLLSCLFKTCNS